MESLRGRLLIAGGGLLDPNFRQAVVLIAEHTEEGAFGIILNRRSPVEVAEAAPELASHVADEHLFLGGPVQPEAAVVLADFEHPDLAGRLVFDSIGFFTGDIGPDLSRGVRRARVFAGHAGWGPGQLEGEIAAHSWIIEAAGSEDVFYADPKRLWRDILRRKGGEYTILSMMPFDPSTN